MQINFANFIDNLYYMGVGMLSIFIVIGLIILVTVALNRLFPGKSEKKG